MRSAISFATFLFALINGQVYPECTAEVVRGDDCAMIINANACYNKFRFQDAQTLTCIDGSDNATKKKQVCKCCNCVGKVMCDWATKLKYCPT